MVLKVVYFLDADGERWAFLVLVPIEPGIFFEYAPLTEYEGEELSA